MPPPRLNKSFHEGMTAELLVKGEVLEGEVEVTNGYTMPPTLFSLFLNQSWAEKCEDDAVVILDDHLI